MKPLLLIPLVFFMIKLTEVVQFKPGAPVWMRTDDILMVFKEPEGSRVRMRYCGEMLVAEDPEYVVESIMDVEMLRDAEDH